jgi:opine dehydrogenase
MRQGGFIMKPKIAVFGNQALNIGHAIAADLSLAGYEVRLFDLPRFHEMLAPVQKLGGIHVSGDPGSLVSGRTGFAEIHMISTDPEEALKEAEILFVDVPAHDYEERIRAIAPYIPDGIIVHFNNYGYWPSLRVAPILKASGKEKVLLSECPAPFYVARGKDGYLDISLMRMGIPLGVFPSVRSEEVFRVLKPIYPTFLLAKNVLETNFENLNMLGHAGIALLNVAYFDRAKEHGETTAFFYRTGITEHTGILSEAQDKERIPVCEAYKAPYVSLRDFLARYYGGAGGSLAEVLLSTKFMQGIPAYSTEMWAQWLKVDVPLAMVPFVLLADLAGARTPIYRGLIDIFGALLQTDFWGTGLTLERLGLAGFSLQEVIRYVTEGKKRSAL